MPGSATLIHCSYHKCLTVYYGRVMRALFNICLPWSGGYRHFNSDLQQFVGSYQDLRAASINNRALDPDALDCCRISRFVRDPRDLVVSGYFYHRSGAEEWTRIESPTAQDWSFANGVVPSGLRAHGSSFARYLQELPLEEGLLAELEFRANHLDSMQQWPDSHPRLAVWKYEDILVDEERAFRELFEFYGLSAFQRSLGLWLARRYSMRSVRRQDPHVRNPSPGQWRALFTDRVTQVFMDRYGGLVERLGYPIV